MWYKPGGKIFNKEYLSNFNKNVPKESTLQEVDFIEKFLKPKTKILDLACGWGRHAIELGARGYEVTALDLNPFYLNVGKKESKRRGISINWIKGDMRRLPFKKNTFDTVLILSNSFGYFEKEEDHQKVINEVRRVLKFQGQLILDVMYLESFFYHFKPEVKVQFNRDHYLFIRNSFDFLKSRWRVEEVDFRHSKKPKKVRYSIRLFSIGELNHLCKNANLTVKKLYDGFSFKPINLKSARCIIIARKPKI